MPQSLACVWLHMMFSTKNRFTFLKDDNFREEMFKMLSHEKHKIEIDERFVWD